VDIDQYSQIGQIGSVQIRQFGSDRSDFQTHTGLGLINRERAPINRESEFGYNGDIGQCSQIGQIGSDQIGSDQVGQIRLTDVPGHQ